MAAGCGNAAEHRVRRLGAEMTPYERAKHAYEQLPRRLKEDFIEAGIWARDTLTKHEGSGHQFEISAGVDGSFSCSFAKPAWSGDHSGDYMRTVAEAICIAVCEYMNGV